MKVEFKFSDTIFKSIMSISDKWGVPCKLLMQIIELAKEEGEVWAYKIVNKEVKDEGKKERG